MPGRKFYIIAGVGLLASLAAIALASAPMTATPLLGLVFAPLAFGALYWPERGHAGEASIVAWFLLALFAIEAVFRGITPDRVGLAGLLLAFGVALANVEAKRRREPLPHQVLGIAADATELQIRAAYRRHIALSHPDRGGSHQAAVAANLARDCMLRALPKTGPAPAFTRTRPLTG